MTVPVNYEPLHHPPAPVPGWNSEAQIVQVFAEANGWRYYALATDQPLPGVVFRERNGAPRFTQRAVNIVRIPGPPLTEIGNSFYTEIAMGNQFTQAWGYAALQLEEGAPPLVVQNERVAHRSALPTLPAAPGVPLGADGRFTLYSDASAHAWAQWLFDDEVRGLLDDGTLGFHVEIAPGWLFLYAPHPLAVPDPAVWQRLLALVSALRSRLGGRVPEAGAPASPSGPPQPIEPVDDVTPAGTPAPPVPQAAPLTMRSNGAAVNGARVWIITGLVVGGGAVAILATALSGALR
ncbi:hypothetical protein AB0N73_15340 [Microbacterium sp. NPDC089189]|uniref:hypothetical protein n=1 Tax=Microbacterium sp. NPDC089189 TaxID=3154972 RepID=UPI0034445B40